MAVMTTRWQSTEAPRGDDYDDRWRSMAAAGENVHGEADLVQHLLDETGVHHAGGRHSVLDAGCGTGRVAIELNRRGFAVSGMDADPQMLAAARGKAPQLTWIEADLSDPAASAGPPVDLVLLAGNVMIFVEPGTEGRVVSNMAVRLAPGGLLVSGFSVRPERLSIARYDGLAESAGLTLRSRWATWDRQPFDGGGYAVSVHRAAR
jgi:SAM-dependent methyltransferase